MDSAVVSHSNWGELLCFCDLSVSVAQQGLRLKTVQYQILLKSVGNVIPFAVARNNYPRPPLLSTHICLTMAGPSVASRQVLQMSVL